MEAAPRLELGVRVLQTRALPLGYAAIFGAVDGTRTRDIHLGKVALYQLSYYREKMVRVKRLELIRQGATDPKSAASAIPPHPLKEMVIHWGFEPQAP